MVYADGVLDGASISAKDAACWVSQRREILEERTLFSANQLETRCFDVQNVPQMFKKGGEPTSPPIPH